MSESALNLWIHSCCSVLGLGSTGGVDEVDFEEGLPEKFTIVDVSCVENFNFSGRYSDVADFTKALKAGADLSKAGAAAMEAPVAEGILAPWSLSIDSKVLTGLLGVEEKINKPELAAPKSRTGFKGGDTDISSLDAAAFGEIGDGGCRGQCCGPGGGGLVSLSLSCGVSV